MSFLGLLDRVTFASSWLGHRIARKLPTVVSLQRRLRRSGVPLGYDKRIIAMVVYYFRNEED